MPGDAERYDLLKRALRLLNSQGITAMQDAGYSPADLARELPLIERALAEGRLTVRTRVSVQISPGDPVDQAIAEARSLAERYRGPLLRFGAVKAYVDGVIEARTAALLEPYSRAIPWRNRAWLAHPVDSRAHNIRCTDTQQRWQTIICRRQPAADRNGSL